MSEPLPPGDNWLMTPRAKPEDIRDINMNRLPSGPASAQNPVSPFPDVIYTTDGRTMLRQPDGSYALAPNQPPPPWAQAQPGQPAPWMQPAATTAKSPLLAGHGLMATLATLATVAIVGVGISMSSGPSDPGVIPPAYTSRPSVALATNPPSAASPTIRIDSGAARANQIVVTILKGCLSRLDEFGLVFEATPGADLENIFQVSGTPDKLFIPDTIAPSDLYTVTITATGSRNHGATSRWAVDISTGGVVPLWGPADANHPLYQAFFGNGCHYTTEMG